MSGRLSRAGLAALLVAVSPSCSRQSPNAPPEKVFITGAIVAPFGVIATALNTKHDARTFLFDRQMRLKRVIGAQVNVGYDGRYVSFDEGNSRITIDTTTFSDITPNGPKIPLQTWRTWTHNSPWSTSVADTTPTNPSTRIDTPMGSFVAFCPQNSTACSLSPPMPCQTMPAGRSAVMPIQMHEPGKYVIVTECERMEGDTQHVKLLAFHPDNRTWTILHRETLERDQWSRMEAGFWTLSSRTQEYRSVVPVRDGKSLEVTSVSIDSGKSRIDVLQVPDDPVFQAYGSLMPESLLYSLLTDQRAVALAHANRMLGSDGARDYAYVSNQKSSALCVSVASAPAKPACSAMKFSTTALPQISGVPLNGRRVDYITIEPPNANGRFVLYVHGGPFTRIEGLTAIPLPLYRRGYTIVIPLYMGGISGLRHLAVPDYTSFDPQMAAREIVAVQRAVSSERKSRASWIVVSESFGGYLSPRLIELGLSAQGYITFAGLCNPALLFDNALDPLSDVHSREPFMKRMADDFGFGCHGYGNSPVPVLGFVYRNDSILGRKGAAAFAQAIGGARLGKVRVSEGTSHGPADFTELENDMRSALEAIERGSRDYHGTGPLTKSPGTDARATER